MFIPKFDLSRGILRVIRRMYRTEGKQIKIRIHAQSKGHKIIRENKHV